MNSKLLKTKQGFTLVELLIVLALMAISTGILLVGKRDDKARADVDSVSRLVAAQIRSLQNESLNGKQIAGISACKYNFSTSVSTTYAVSYGNCTAGNPVIAAGNQTIDLAKKKVSFDGAVVSLNFSAPSGKVDAKKTIVLKSMLNPTIKGWVCVAVDGNVVEQKIACP